MKKVVIGALALLALTGCVRRQEVDLKTLSDSEIMQARNAVAGYESRIKKLQDDTARCISLLDKKYANHCYIKSITENGFSKDESGYSISAYDTRTYQKNLLKATVPLTTELSEGCTR